MEMNAGVLSLRTFLGNVGKGLSCLILVAPTGCTARGQETLEDLKRKARTYRFDDLSKRNRDLFINRDFKGRLDVTRFEGDVAKEIVDLHHVLKRAFFAVNANKETNIINYELKESIKRSRDNIRPYLVRGRHTQATTSYLKELNHIILKLEIILDPKIGTPAVDVQGIKRECFVGLDFLASFQILLLKNFYSK